MTVASQLLAGAMPVAAITTKEEIIPVQQLSSFQRNDQRDAYLGKAQTALREVRPRPTAAAHLSAACDGTQTDMIAKYEWLITFICFAVSFRSAPPSHLRLPPDRC